MEFIATNSIPALSGRSKGKHQRETDQMMGRIGHSGHNRLKKLTNRHLKILTLHLSGDFSNVGVARELGCSVTTVQRVLGDPLAQTLINDFQAGHLQELEALLPKAITAVRKGLSSGDVKTSLLAVDRFLKMTGQDADQHQGPNISITVINARSRFVDTLKEAAAAITIDQEPADGSRTSPSSSSLVEGRFNKITG